MKITSDVKKQIIDNIKRARDAWLDGLPDKKPWYKGFNAGIGIAILTINLMEEDENEEHI